MQTKDIPACVGSTAPWSSEQSDHRDHPRLRGEYDANALCFRLSSGSSPLTRGVHSLKSNSISRRTDWPQLGAIGSTQGAIEDYCVGMSNPVLDAIATRDSCRAFTSEPVSQADLETLALAGVCAPSARGNQPWRIVVVTDQSLISDISDSALRLMARHEPSAYQRFSTGLKHSIFYEAPALFVIATRRTWDYVSEEFDAGLVAQNIALAATSLGLGSLMNGFSTQAFRDLKSDDADRLYARLGIPRDYAVTISVAVGHRDEPSTPHTPDLSTVTYI